jgi:radical SAM protein with 4Fe4S-binding SPASM domain
MFKAVEIEINHDCNRACAYCPNSTSQRKNQGRMSEELFRHLMTQLREVSFKGRVSYHFYNEPLLSPDLEKFVVLTKEYLPETLIEIYTNGTLLNEERLYALFERGADKFTVTQHHGLKNFPFAELYEKLPKTVQEKIKFQNYRDLYLTNRGGLVKVGYKKQKPPLNLPCLIPSALFVVTVNGNVVPCFEDYGEENVMGNIQEQDLMSIWNSKSYVDFRESLKNKRRGDFPVCRNCNRQTIIS